MASRRAVRLYLIVLAFALVAVGARAASTAAPSQVAYALRLATATYGVPYVELRAVSYCESRWNPRADGVSGSGLFQFTRLTWASTPYRRFSPFDPIANALAAAWLVRQDGGWREWTCKP